MVTGKVLVIDDEQDVRDVIRLQLEQHGLHVLEAENGEEAIKILHSENNLVNIGVILCDIRMPKINGIEAIDYLKKNAPGIPVVVITGYPDTELAVGLLKKGVKDYLVKPVEKEKLFQVVDDIIAAGKDFDF
ncbi:response regulator [Nitrospina watsonii]|uniref:Response regulator, CheY-like n=1 Tax=Nitrospina watsonii TaxID=1323948 RepID=A0ABN8VVC2_9BACT|nr:response regulator [Nitrospina watsonii]CAI2717725.1 Putative Response regulator, CheY-like [Nitrospina watsonii]